MARRLIARSAQIAMAALVCWQILMPSSEAWGQTALEAGPRRDLARALAAGDGFDAGVESIRDLFSDCPVAELQDDPDTTIALCARWKTPRGTCLPMSFVEQFAAFIEDRTGHAAPRCWQAAAFAVFYRHGKGVSPDHFVSEFAQFEDTGASAWIVRFAFVDQRPGRSTQRELPVVDFPETGWRESAPGVFVEPDVETETTDGQLVLSSDGRSAVVRLTVIEAELDLEPGWYDHTLAFSERGAIICSYEDQGAFIWMQRCDAWTGRQDWRERVWGAGRPLVPQSTGPSIPPKIVVTADSESSILWGYSGVGDIYCEGFETSTGRVLFRWSNRLAEPESDPVPKLGVVRPVSEKR